MIIFLLEAINNQVRGRKDLNELSIPFIGEIPIHRRHRTLKEKMFGPWKKLWNNIMVSLKLAKEEEDKTLHILVMWVSI